MGVYARLLSYIKPYWLRVVGAFLALILVSMASLLIPWIIKDVIDKVLLERDLFRLNLITVGIIAIALLRSVLQYGQTYLISFIGQKVVTDIRNALYRHLQALSLSYYESRRTGAIMSHVTNDVAVLQNAITAAVIDLVSESIVLLGSILFMFYIDWTLTVLTLITLPLVAYTISVFGRKLRRASNVIQDRAADITTILQETISAVRVVKSFVREDYEIERFTNQNQNNFRATMKGAQLNAMLTPIVELLGILGVTIIIWYGGRQVIVGHLTSGALVAYLIYVVNISNPIRRLSRVFSVIQQALAAAERIFTVMDTEPEIKDHPQAIVLPKVQGLVQFHNVSFAYNRDEIVLEGINLTARPGEMVALVGPSGAGKTTIANLIPRFYDPVEGRITIDGYDIRYVTVASLRQQIGIVPQETVLFNGTIRDNIAYGKLEAGEEEIVAAARAANAHDFIMALPAGYDTNIGDRGLKLSGGQRQRIAIARALLKDPRILILDEATSALDTESERLVQDALDKLMVNRTTFVIAHRLSTVQRANKIMVLERGRIAEMGTHQELLARGGLYSKLYSVQFSGLT